MPPCIYINRVRYACHRTNVDEPITNNSASTTESHLDAHSGTFAVVSTLRDAQIPHPGEKYCCNMDTQVASMSRCVEATNAVLYYTLAGITLIIT